MVPWARRSLTCWWTVLGLVIATPAGAGFTVTDLGVIARGQTSGGTGINAQGSASGTATNAIGMNQAAVAVDGGGFQAIDTSRLPGASISFTAGINAAGDVVGTFYNTIDRRYHAFKTSNGQAIDLGTFATGRFRGANTSGAGISAAGEVVGTARLGDGSQVAFRSTGPGALTAIKLPGASSVGQASGINDSGMVVGSYLNAQGVSRIFTAAGGQDATDLLLGGDTRGFGLNQFGSAINSRGDVAGYGDFGGQSHAFFVTTDPTSDQKTLVDIGVGEGFTASVSIGLNNRGQVVGSMDNRGFNSHAFLWDRSVGLLDLNNLLSPADRSIWTLAVATGINDSSQITGQGYINGQLHGFLLTPVPGVPVVIPAASVPAPPSLWMALGGLAMVGGWVGLKRGRTADLGTV